MDEFLVEFVVGVVYVVGYDVEGWFVLVMLLRKMFSFSYFYFYYVLWDLYVLIL